MIENPEIELAFQFLSETNTNVFLTGKAGTGKTTFLKRVKKEVNKRMAIIAPTGVAAINAEGVTIHSLFQLPFGPIVPGQTMSGSNQRRFNRKKINLIKSLDLLIIDEISMVRADVLDAIDTVLKKYRTYSKPFGGVQVLMIGDLHQLPPIVQGEEWSILQPYYKTAYFFGSIALQSADYVTIHLKHIYRQQDSTFIDLLNKVRNNEMSENVLTLLNSRYQENFEPKEGEGYITLTSHNRAAESINNAKLVKLKTQAYRFEAKITGEFPEYAYPTSYKLELREGAQVMFVKNDLSEEKLFYNGKIGKVVSLTKNSVSVLCEGDTKPIDVEALTWENRKFELNEATKEVKEDIVGGFKQYPLKLAWAITIHKSQGLTFERVIIDAKDAFAHGQVYVALSRCKTFEGVVLRSKIVNSSVKTDVVVKDYTAKELENEPNDERLFLSKKDYQSNILRDIFVFQELERFAEQYRRLTVIHSQKIQNDLESEFAKYFERLIKEIISVGRRFLNELTAYFVMDELPELNTELNERLVKAIGYFTDKRNELQSIFVDYEPLTDNTEIEDNLAARKSDVLLEFEKMRVAFKQLTKGFKPKLILQAIANAEIDKKEVRPKSVKKTLIPKDVKHKDLYANMVSWRRNLSEENNYPAYRVLTTKTLLEIVNVLPTTADALSKISGLGKVKLKEFGSTIIEMVSDYCTEAKIAQVNVLDFATGSALKKNTEPKKGKVDTKKLSFELFKKGKSTKEIAKERGFAETTIEGHIAHYVGTGDLSVFDFVPREKVRLIVKYFSEADNEGLTLAKEYFKDNYSYTELRMVREHWKFVMESGVV